MRGRLAASGELFGGYHPEMEAVHLANADRLARVLDAHGWPGAARFGEEAAAAAWLIAQHAIGLPALQRRCLAALELAAANGGVSAVHAAFLGDRIRVLEGRPQRYGTQFDWSADGRLSPSPIEDAAGVDARRAAVGLGPLAARTAELRARAAAEGDRVPADPAARAAEQDAWARRVGWR